MHNAALFLFLAATVVSTFAFVSIAVWVGTQSQERKTRDRLALLKTLAEHPSESAMRVLEMMREDETRKAEQKEREERRGFLAGGLVCIATGVGLSIMMVALSPNEGVWSVGLMISLIGVALLPFGLSSGLRSGRRTKHVEE